MQRLWKFIKKNKKLNEPITVSTPNGKITITRNIDYCFKCGKTYGQCDEELKISGVHRITKDLLEITTYISQMIPGYKNAQNVLLKLKGIDISASQINILSKEVGQVLFEEQVKQANISYEKPEITAPEALEKDKIDTILYILMDGSAVNTRIQDKDGSTWREMKLGLTFLDKDVIKRKDDKAIITKKDYVTYLGSVDEFKKLLFNSAVEAGYGKVKKVVVIGDGAHWIWNLCRELFPDAECILDFYHMTENVYSYAKELFFHNEKQYTKWAETVIYYIKTEQFSKALIKIKNSPLPKKKARNIVNLEGYIQNNIGRIKYLEYKNKGYYIGSGMIESGNKLVVQKRMKQSGMRWGNSGAQYMAILRAKYESNRWNDVENIVFNHSIVA